MGSQAPAESRAERTRVNDAPPPAAPNANYIDMMRTAPDRPKGGTDSLDAMANKSFKDFGDIYAGTATDRTGQACGIQPDKSQLPYLKPGEASPGCEYTNDKRDPLTAKIYEEHKDQTVTLDVFTKAQDGTPPGGRKGSGVMIAKGNGTCDVLTDMHVTNGTQNLDDVTLMKGSVNGGERFSAKITAKDPSRDLAIVTMDTGDKTDKVCKPATIARDTDSIRNGNQTVTLGYPEQARSVYASPGVSEGKSMLINSMTTGFAERIAGEDTGRDVFKTNAQVYKGNSGGPVFNPAGEVAGLVTRKDSGSINTPITEDVIRSVRNK